MEPWLLPQVRITLTKKHTHKMKIIVDKAKLADAASILARVINTKNTLPILCNVLFDVRGNKVTLTGSDSEVTLSTTIPLDAMKGEGKFCVQVSDLCSAISELSDEKVTIIVEDEGEKRFTLLHSTGEIYFPTQDAGLYPMIKKENLSAPVTLPGGQIRDALKRSLWATATDDLRPTLNGIYMSMKLGSLDVVASNGQVLVKSVINVGKANDETDEFGVILPKKAASIMSSVLDDDDIFFSIGNNAGCVEFRGYKLEMRLVDGRYPNYNSVIPESQPMETIMPRDEVMNSLRKVVPFAEQMQGSYPLRLFMSSNRIKLVAENTDICRGSYDIIPVNYEGESMTLALPGSNLASILSNICEDHVVMGLSDPRRIVSFEPLNDPDGCVVKMMLMPLRISAE